MLKISDKFSAERDVHGWKLYQKIDAKDKHGNPKDRIHTTYHPNMMRVCDAVVDREAGLCSDLSELKTMLSTTSDLLTYSMEQKEEE